MKKISLFALTSILVTGCASNNVTTEDPLESINQNNEVPVNKETLITNVNDVEVKSTEDLKNEMQELIDSEYEKKITQLWVGRALALQELDFDVKPSADEETKKIELANLGASLQTLKLSPNKYSEIEKELVELSYELTSAELELIFLEDQKNVEQSSIKKRKLVEWEYENKLNNLKTWHSYETDILDSEINIDNKYKAREDLLKNVILELNDQINTKVNEEDWD